MAQENPRSLADEEVLESQEAVQAKLIELQSQLASLEWVQELFTHRGWPYVKEALEAQRETLLSSLINRGMSPETVQFFRGGIVQLDVILGLEDSCMRAREDVQSQLADVGETQETEEE